MIDNKTTNKNYPLPHPENIASQDVERIATSISMIDEDIGDCDAVVDDVQTTLETLQQQALRIPADKIGTIDPEIQNPTARKYLVVNDDATGFTTVEGGGGEGGLKGEILVKRSDENFDTTWMDPRAITKQAMTTTEVTDSTILSSNGSAILCDTLEIDNGLHFPRHGLTQRQITANDTGDVNYSYIIESLRNAFSLDQNVRSTDSKKQNFFVSQ